MAEYAPGMRVIIRDEEWMIKVEEEINCSWVIDGTRLIITGDKIPGDWEDESVPWYDSASTITEVEINGIEKIPNDLFDGLDSLQRIILGDATTDMKHRAFEDLPEDWRCPRCRQPKTKFNKA